MVKVLSLLFSFFYLGQPKTDLEITIAGIKESRGEIMVAIYQPQQKFTGEDMFLGKKLSAEKTGELTFKVSLPEGSYAISAYHDLNSDSKLNTNLLGIPREPYGFSVTRGSFGPPSFEEASFKIPETKSITIGIE